MTNVRRLKLIDLIEKCTFTRLVGSEQGGGQGGGTPGEKGAGRVREEGEEGAGSGIPKVAGSGRKREKLPNIAQYFAIEKIQRGGGAKKYRAGTGIKGYWKRQV